MASINSRWRTFVAVALAALGGVSCGGGSDSGSTPVFTQPISTELGAAPGDLVWGDFNGDARVDVALTLVDGGLYMLLGNGDGTFQAARAIAGVVSVGDIAIGDLNGDGTLDLAVSGCAVLPCSPFNLSLFTLLGNGDGTFQSPVAYPVSATAVAIGDLDRDGHADVAVGHDGLVVSILLGAGDGTLDMPTYWPTGTAGLAPTTVAIEMAEVNMDGKQDLVDFRSGGFGGAVSILLGRGNGTFESPLAQGTVVSPLLHAIADFNRDGRPDVAINGDRFRGPGQLTILLGNGDGTFGSPINPVYPVAYRTATFAVGDLDRDGIPDLVVRSSDTSALSILYGKGDGTFLPAQDFPLSLDGASVDRLIDLNGDGRLDLVLTTASGLAVLLGTR